MKAARIPSFRNLHALIVHPDDNDRRLLDGRLRRLGLEVHCLDGAPPTALASHADVIFFDVDTGVDGQFEGLSSGVKLIALVGAETPGRLEWMLAQEPDAWLMKPIRSSGVYTALAAAFHRSKQKHDVEEYVERLRSRARCRAPVEAAIAQIIRRTGCTEGEAFGILRRKAMDARLSVIALSESLLANDAVAEQRALERKDG